MGWPSVIAAFALAGCSSIFGLESPVLGDAHPPDDVARDTACATFSRLLDTCALESMPQTALTVADDEVFDTDTNRLGPAGSMTIATTVLAQPNNVEISVLRLSELTIDDNSSLRIVGSRPAILLVYGDAQIAGVLDVSRGGAGSRPACGSSQGQDDPGGAGGGGGGAFQGAGGSGGRGDSDGSSATSLGGIGGNATPFDGKLRGGCAGSRGGSTLDNVLGGAPGAGGGGIAVVARGTLVIDGVVDAGGGGGTAGAMGAFGGGGGGAGGMIILEAPAMTLDGIVVANGGGGGEGGGNSVAGGSGQPGQRSTARATGGAGFAAGGGDGGSGGAVQDVDGAASTDFLDAGGGGGGGGAGFVVLVGTVTGNGVRSPQPSTWPP